MSHSRIFSTTEPIDDNYAGDGDNKIIENQIDLKERLTLDHCMDDVLDVSDPRADGYHRKVTLAHMTTDPTILSGSGVLYSKAGGLFYKNSAGVVQIV